MTDGNVKIELEFFENLQYQCVCFHRHPNISFGIRLFCMQDRNIERPTLPVKEVVHTLLENFFIYFQSYEKTTTYIVFR